MKEAAISYSPHAYVPKRTLTEEERVELYRTRIDASFKPYTVIDVLQKVYHRSFEDDLLNAVTLHPEWFQPSVDGWKLARAWIRSLRIIRPEFHILSENERFSGRYRHRSADLYGTGALWQRAAETSLQYR